jgi:tRNA nucleotidyltransferase/poly(A) polymerase/predicted kinase
MRIFKIAEQKRLIVMRGLPGSGKSTLAKELIGNGEIFSTDDYFMHNGSYIYDKTQTGNAHSWNQWRVKKAMLKGVNPIVVDNTNITWDSVIPYVTLAKINGYSVEYAEPNTEWKFNVDELTRRNKHGVPKEVIQKMVDRWQPTETFGLNKQASTTIDTNGFAKSGRLTQEEIELFSILMNVIKTKTPTTTVRAVGGWVRDKLLGKQPHDIDLMVDNIGGPAFAKIVTSYLGMSDPHTIRSNPEQSKNIETARMYIPLSSGVKLEIDVAQTRQDVYQGSSRIPSTVAATPEEDSFRRDLTVNCIFYNINKDQIEDFTLKGINDLQEHIIRTPLDPYKTFSDDPLRMLRCCRFASRYGWKITPEVFNALSDSNLRNKLKTKVSRERKGIEIKEMLSTGYPEVAVELLFDSGIFEDLLLDSTAGGQRDGRLSNITMDQNNPHHNLIWSEHTKALARGVARKYRGQDKDKVFQVMMAAILHDIGKLDSASRQQKGDYTSYHGHEDTSKEMTADFMKFIKLEPFSKGVEALVGSHMRPHALTSVNSIKALRKFIREMEEAGVDWTDVVNISQADALAKGGEVEEGVESRYTKLIEDGSEEVKSMPISKGTGIKLVLNGGEIMKEFNLKPGPEVGKMLQEVKDMMDENPAITKEEALKKLRSNIVNI